MKNYISNFIDLTTLSIDDTKEKVKNLCKKGIEKKVAAICVYPTFISLVKKELEGTNIKVVSVAGAFPAAQTPIEIKLNEIKYAINNGADEIDVVISVGKIIEGEYDIVANELKQMRNATKGKILKCILETGALKSFDLVQKSSQIAIDAGVDFIKTSTGKITPGATIDTSKVMIDTIKSHYQNTGKKIGFKAAGGISNYETALSYINLVKDTLSKEWLTPNLFRIGASRLIDIL